MMETANSLEAEISTLRRALEEQKEDLTNRERSVNAIKDKLEAINATKAPGSKGGARKKKEEVKSLKKQISERVGTILKVRQEIEDKEQVLEELKDRLAALKLKEATIARLSQFPHKKFRQEEHQGIVELDTTVTTLTTNETYLQSSQGQLEQIELENWPEANGINDKSQENELEHYPFELAISNPEIWGEISGKLWDNSWELVSESWNKESLESLQLDGVQDPSLLVHLAPWFPNLRKLYLSFSGVEFDDIALLLSGLVGLKLKKLEIQINFCDVLRLSDLIKALLSNPELFNGMKKLEITASVTPEKKARRRDPPAPSAIDDLDREAEDGNSLSGFRQDFIDWLESTTINMKCVLFRGLRFSRTTAAEVCSVIRRKKLPVKLVKNYCEKELFEIN